MATDRKRIDVHHHIVPPAYASWLGSHGYEALDDHGHAMIDRQNAEALFSSFAESS